MTITGLLVILFPLLAGALHQAIVHSVRRRRCANRLGRLPGAATPTAAAARAARLCQLGELGTYRVYNCGKILHVDYERGELIVEREGRYLR